VPACKHSATELRTVIEAQHAEHERLKKRGNVVPWVFFRTVANERRGRSRPKPIKSFSKAFATACRERGVQGASCTTSHAPLCEISNSPPSR